MVRLGQTVTSKVSHSRSDDRAQVIAEGHYIGQRDNEAWYTGADSSTTYCNNYIRETPLMAANEK